MLLRNWFAFSWFYDDFVGEMGMLCHLWWLWEWILKSFKWLEIARDLVGDWKDLNCTEFFLRPFLTCLEVF